MDLNKENLIINQKQGFFALFYNTDGEGGTMLEQLYIIILKLFKYFKDIF